ncbi:MAG: hypothetical protein J6R30_08495 [Bacteroidales bacterium]|nr:hypothetical protein [Bacteroidales bacterium]
MSVNELIWGPITEGNTQFKNILGDTVKFTQNVETTLNQGNSKFEPLDNSVCLLGFGNTSPYVNARIVAWNPLTDLLVDEKMYDTNVSVLSYALGIAGNGELRYYEGIGGTNSHRNEYRWITCYPPNDSGAIGYLGRAINEITYITDYEYQRKWLILVQPVCTETHTTGGDTIYEGSSPAYWCTIDKWWNDEKTDYPCIARIIAVPYTYSQDYNLKSGVFSCFETINQDFNIEFDEQSEYYNKFLIPKEWQCYKNINIGYSNYRNSQANLRYFNFGFTLAGCYFSEFTTIRTAWTPYYKPVVGDWTVHHCKPVSAGGTSNAYCTYSTYNPHNKTKNQVIDDIAHIAAHIGGFFIFETEYTSAANDNYNVFLGLLDNGVSTGEYSRGTDNRNSDQYNWDSATEANYNPDAPSTQDFNSVESTFNAVSIADGVKKYVFDDTNLQAFGNSMFDIIDTTDPDELIQNQTLTNFLTNNPLDCIVAVKRFPLPDMSQGTSQNPVIGKVTVANCLAKPFTSDSVIYTCGSLDIPVVFGNYLDYQCQYVLTLPFCGTCELDAQTITGNTIEVKYSIDYNTGTCTAWVLARSQDGKSVVIDSANGNCAIDVPMSGIETATLTGEIYNGNENLKAAKFNGIISGVASVGKFATSVSQRDFTGALTSAASIVDNVHSTSVKQWNVDHTQIPFKMIGGSSACNSLQLELYPRLTVYRPVVDSTLNLADYLHNVGAATCHSTTLGSYTGYVEATNVDLSGFDATVTEKQIIVSALNGGVYL